MKKIFLVLYIVLIYSNSYSQMFNKFSIAAGPVFGWNVPSITDLNTELQKAGLPELSKSGILATGGSVFIDLPVVKGLRVGYTGYGFTSNSSSTFSTNSKVAEFSYSTNALTVEYSQKLGKVFDYTLGGMIGVGSTNLKLVNYSNTFKEWNINHYLNDTNSSGHNSLTFKNTSYSIVPQAGIGLHATKFLYFKLDAGYLLTINSKWKLDDLIEVNNFPSGIKADGFMMKLGVFIGLFID
ncbi:MAG: hypothetical protein WCK13_12100 [Ignavibacteriota bacterium]